MVEIIKFGTITENDKGWLVFKGFTIESHNMPTNEEVLTAAIGRLNSELDKLKEVNDEQRGRNIT